MGRVAGKPGMVKNKRRAVVLWRLLERMRVEKRVKMMKVVEAIPLVVEEMVF